MGSPKLSREARDQIIRLHWLGYRDNEAAELVGCHRNTVRNVIKTEGEGRRREPPATSAGRPKRGAAGEADRVAADPALAAELTAVRTELAALARRVEEGELTRASLTDRLDRALQACASLTEWADSVRGQTDFLECAWCRKPILVLKSMAAVAQKSEAVGYVVSCPHCKKFTERCLPDKIGEFQAAIRCR